MTEDVGLIMNPGRAADRGHCEHYTILQPREEPPL